MNDMNNFFKYWIREEESTSNEVSAFLMWRTFTIICLSVTAFSISIPNSFRDYKHSCDYSWRRGRNLPPMCNHFHRIDMLFVSRSASIEKFAPDCMARGIRILPILHANSSSMTLGEYPLGFKFIIIFRSLIAFWMSFFLLMFPTIKLRVAATADATIEANLRYATIPAKLV